MHSRSHESPQVEPNTFYTKGQWVNFLEDQLYQLREARSYNRPRLLAIITDLTRQILEDARLSGQTELADTYRQKIQTELGIEV